ncbi:MAG: glycosyltransferase family 2 protein [Candidatus Omnitrophica bacterium]|nr:glycosyltransferase family 2 protein [Candidatus Omnitrophota bacterium]
MPKILVCPIAFNENVKLKSVIERFLKSPARKIADYLVMDDCSTDGTTEMIRSFAVQGVATIRHEKQSGVGVAIRTAIRYAQKNQYDVIVIMAGNDKDNPDEITAVIKPIVDDGYDFVQGSRYKGKVGTGGDMPFYRKVATRMHPMLMSFFTGASVTDSTNGFRAFRVKIIDDRRIDLDQDWLDHYELEPYLMFKAIKLGYKFTEVFVTKIYPPKKLGYTKMKPLLGWWSILKPLFYLGLGIKK